MVTDVQVPGKCEREKTAHQQSQQGNLEELLNSFAGGLSGLSNSPLVLRTHVYMVSGFS